MSTWDKWVNRPRTIWVRRLLFQVHLWSGIGLGIYILIVCLSGSAAVFNNEPYVAFLPSPKTEASHPRLQKRRIYPLSFRFQLVSQIFGEIIAEFRGLSTGIRYTLQESLF